MAREIVELIKSDITGEKGAQGWEFELLGKKFGIDLLESEWESLNDLIQKIAPFLEAAEDRSPGQATIVLPAQGARTRTDAPDPVKVRAWATESGHTIDGKGINERGRVPKAWNEAYLAAHAEKDQGQELPAAPPVVEPQPVTAEPYQEEEDEIIDPSSVPGRLEDDTDRETAEDKPAKGRKTSKA